MYWFACICCFKECFFAWVNAARHMACSNGLVSSCCALHPVWTKFKMIMVFNTFFCHNAASGLDTVWWDYCDIHSILPFSFSRLNCFNSCMKIFCIFDVYMFCFYLVFWVKAFHDYFKFVSVNSGAGLMWTVKCELIVGFDGNRLSKDLSCITVAKKQMLCL